MLPSRMQGWFLLLQRFPVPLPQLRSGIVGALREIEQDFIRVLSGAHRIVRKDELAQLGLVKRNIWLNFRFCESRWFRIRIGIKNWCWCGGIARPETEAAYFLRVGLARNHVRQMWDSPRMRWRLSPGETRHCQIKTAPEKMHRTAFAAKPRSEFFEDPIALHKNAPESIHIFGVVRAMLFILIKRDRIFNLVRHAVNDHRQIEIAKSLHHEAIKFRNRL